MKTRRRIITSETYRVPVFLAKHPGEREHRGQRRAQHRILKTGGTSTEYRNTTFHHPPRMRPAMATRGKLTGRTKGAFGWDRRTAKERELV